MKPTERLDSSVKKALTPGERASNHPRLHPAVATSAVSNLLYSITSLDLRFNLTLAGQMLEYLIGEASGVASPPFLSLRATVWFWRTTVWLCGRTILQSHKGPLDIVAMLRMAALSDEDKLTAARVRKMEKSLY